ncbi:MAG: hypothetical protein DMD91_22290 [Candidatus Rokuibacteriota bacterium]|nr:MAG: hypothetical protein DMD91_22290 [Candidatus Rokubacteria bacterium]
MSFRRIAIVACLAAALALAATATAQSAFESALEAGLAAMRANRYRDALERFREAVAVAPDNVAGLLARVRAANSLGEFEEAVIQARAIVGFSPAPEHQAWLAAVAERAGFSDEARAAYRASVQGEWLGRSDIAESFLLFLVDNGDYPAALDLARAEGWIAPERDYCRDPIPGINRRTGMLLAWMIHPEQAPCLLSVARSLTDEGYTRLPRRILADLTAKTDDQKLRTRAAAFLRARLPQHDVSTAAEALNGAGYSLARRLQYEDAILAYQRAMAADPRFSWPPSNLARVYINRKDYTQALDWLQKAVALNPDHLRAVQNLGWTLNELGRRDEALAIYQRALALDPDDAWTHANIGWALLKLGRESEAVPELQTSLRLDPSQRNVRTFLDTRFGSDPRLGPTPFGSNDR